MTTEPLMILVAGPYRSGTDGDPVRIAANVAAMTEVSLALYRRGHLPVMGEWFALPLIEEARRLEPNAAGARVQRALILAGLGRGAEASTIVDAVAGEMNAGRLSRASFLTAQHAALRAVRKNDAADRAFEEIRIIAAQADTGAWEVLGMVLDTVIFLAPYEQLGPAFEILDTGMHAGIVPPYDWLMLNPKLASLRRDARFSRIAIPARAQFDRVYTILTQARERGELPPYLERPLTKVMAGLHSTSVRD
jgi:hypothetical protein